MAISISKIDQKINSYDEETLMTQKGRKQGKNCMLEAK